MNEKTISDIIAQETQVGGDHYKKMPVEPWDVMKAILTEEEWFGYLKGSVIKYAMRNGHKPGADDDPEKCLDFMRKLNKERCSYGYSDAPWQEKS
jgi:hypothetical protein